MNKKLIEQLRNGEIAVENDGTLEQLRDVLRATFYDDFRRIWGDYNIYYRANSEKYLWDCNFKTELPAVSVKEFLKDENMNYKGQIKNFPIEVVEKMLEYQVEQGNKKDVSVFEKTKHAGGGDEKGFNWDKTEEGDEFWNDVILQENFNRFFKRHPKQQKQQPMKNNLPPIGTKVYHHFYGEGKIVKHYNDCVGVKFETVGRPFDINEVSLTPYTVEGFTALSDYDKPKVGDWGYFWDDEQAPPVYGKIKSLNENRTFREAISGRYFLNFSKELPEHIKKLQNQ